MGRALEVLNGSVTNPGATLTPVTPNVGDTFTVRSANFGTEIELLDAWVFTGTNLVARVRSPRMHDQAQNMRLQPSSGTTQPLLPWEQSEPLFPQDPITFELAGDAAAVDLGALLVYYSDLPGIQARLHTMAEVDPLIQHLTTVEVDLTSSATAGQYGATVALNGTFDTLIRNRTYAILGYTCAVSAGSLGIRGADTGNLRVGGPLCALPHLTNDWFVRLSSLSGYPCIPVFNSANVAGILLDCTAQAASASVKVGLNLALLSDPNSL